MSDFIQQFFGAQPTPTVAKVIKKSSSATVMSVSESFLKAAGHSEAKTLLREQELKNSLANAPETKTEKDLERLRVEAERLKKWEDTLFEREATFDRQKEVLLTQTRENGYKEGYQLGFDQAQKEREILHSLIQEVGSSYQDLYSNVAQKSFELAVCAASQIVHDSGYLHSADTHKVMARIIKEMGIKEGEITVEANQATLLSLCEHLSFNGEPVEIGSYKGVLRFEVNDQMETSGFKLKHGSSDIDMSIEDRWAQTMGRLAGGRGYQETLEQSGTTLSKENEHFARWLKASYPRLFKSPKPEGVHAKILGSDLND